MSDSVQLPCDPTSVALARQFVTRAVEAWSGSIDLDDLQLLTSEIVTNAVVHGQSEVGVAIDLGPASVRVEVRDHGDHALTRREARPIDTSGRGLAIVNETAAHWGIDEIPGDGKVVWFELNSGA